MSLIQRISRIVRANIGFMVDKAEDPIKGIDYAVEELTDLKVQQTHAVAEAIASHKQLQQQYDRALGNANQFQSLAKQAILKGREDLASAALVKRNEHNSTAQSLLAAIESQQTNINDLKSQLQQIDTKIQEVRVKKDVLKAQAATAKAQDALNRTSGGAMTAFAKIEEKILFASEKSRSLLELDSEYQDAKLIRQLNASSIDEDLMDLKAQVLPQSQQLAIASGAAPNAIAPSQSLSLEEELRIMQQQLLPQPTTTPQGRVVIQITDRVL